MVDRKLYPHEMKDNTDDGEKVYYSNLMVLESGAGFYIGRMGFVVSKTIGEYPEPYSRESEYYPNKESAEEDLKSGEFGRISGIEDEYAKSIGNLPK